MSKQASQFIRQRLYEGGFLFIVGLSAFLLLALFTYHRADPSWSHASMNQQVANAGGRVGAWFADVFLYMFGYIAYLLPFISIFFASRTFLLKPERLRTPNDAIKR